MEDADSIEPINQPNRTLYILNSVIRSISHSIRTPLSVIANDLEYMRQSDTSLDCSRALINLERIANYLSDTINSASQKVSKKAVPLTEVFCCFAESGFILEDKKHFQPALQVDLPLIRNAMNDLVSIVSESTESILTEKSLSISDRFLIFQISFSSSESRVRGQFSFLVQFLQALGKEKHFVSAAAVDSIILEHNAEMSVDFKPETFCFLVKLPWN